MLLILGVTVMISAKNCIDFIGISKFLTNKDLTPSSCPTSPATYFTSSGFN